MGLFCEEFWAIFICLIFVHFNMYGICCGSVRCLLGSGVFCVALSRQTRNDLFPPPLLVGCGLSPGPKWLRDCNGWGDLGVAWLRVVSWLGLISRDSGSFVS